MHVLAVGMLVPNSRGIMGEHTKGWMATGVGVQTKLAIGAASSHRPTCGAHVTKEAEDDKWPN
jgi:hypothetical protein